MAEFTPQDLITVDEALVSGALKVTYSDAGGATRIVEYRSVSDLIKVRALIIGYLDSINGTIPIRQTRMWGSKGW